MSRDRDVVIVDGVRTPFVKFNTDFRTVPAVELGRVAVREAIEREPDAEGQFQVMCRKAVAYLAEDDALRRLLVRDPDIFPMFPANDPYADINANSVAMIRSILERGIAEQRFRAVDLETVPEIIFSVYKMFIIRMYIKSRDRAQEEMFTQTVALITQGLYSKPSEA